MKSLRDQCRASGESKMKRMTGGSGYATGGKVPPGAGFQSRFAPAPKAEMRPAGKAAKARLDRPRRANGGKVAPTINVNLPPKAGKMPMMGPMAPPPEVPPMGAGAGPSPAMGLGPAAMPMVNAPPVALAGGVPQDVMNPALAPPMRRGGRTAYRKGGRVKKMDAGAGSAEGRLEKIGK